MGSGGGNDHDHMIMLCMELKPSYDRTRLMEDPAMAKIGAIISNHWLQLNGPNNRSLLPREVKVKHDLIRGTFQLSRAQIEKLRKLNDVDVDVSSFCVTCAFTWVCLVKSEERVEENDNKIILSFAADCRSRLEPSLPATCFGNCLTRRTIDAETQELLGEKGFIVALNAVNKAIKSSEIKGQLLNGVESWVSSMTRNSYDHDRSATGHKVVLGRRQYIVMASPQFKVYDTDFGWGRPRKADVVTTDRIEGLSLSDSRNGGGGVEIGLCLKKDHMEAFASFFAQGLQSL